MAHILNIFRAGRKAHPDKICIPVICIHILLSAAYVRCSCKRPRRQCRETCSVCLERCSDRVALNKESELSAVRSGAKRRKRGKRREAAQAGQEVRSGASGARGAKRRNRRKRRNHFLHASSAHTGKIQRLRFWTRSLGHAAMEAGATHQAEYDFLMDGRRVEIKSARMAWSSTE